MWYVILFFIGVIFGYFTAIMYTMSARNELRFQLDQARIEYELLATNNIRTYIKQIERGGAE